jgi:hypothetical protein
MINASVISSLLSEKFPQSDALTKVNLRAPSIREQEIADHLGEILNSIINSHTYTVESETTLDYISTELSEDDVDQYGSDDSELDPDFNDTGDDKDGVLLQKFSLDYMKKVVEYYDEKDPLTGKRRRSWKNVQHRFKRVRDLSYIRRFRAYIEKGGTRLQKLESVNNYVYHKFEQARQSYLPVHDLDLRRWSLEKARQELFHDFVASQKWLFNFKIQHNICSRKVTNVSNFSLLFTIGRSLSKTL